MPSDVAGATFMAIATSAPELFTNIIGTFITHGDIGIGTIVGSAVFNILAVAAVCGIGAGMVSELYSIFPILFEGNMNTFYKDIFILPQVVPLEWWSVTRDCLCYSVAVILLITVLRDERIYWYEALILVLVYVIYIIGKGNISPLKYITQKKGEPTDKPCMKDS